VFERFTDRARRVVLLAQEEARMLDHHYIGSEHVLLGLVHEGEGVAAKILQEEGIALDALREDVKRLVGTGSSPSPGEHIPFTPRAKKILELSLRESLNLRHTYIGTEHILLGLIREGGGAGAQALIERGVDFDQIRQKVIEETRLQREGGGHSGAFPSAGPSLVAKVDRLQEAVERIERRLDAMNAPPDPGPPGSAE
jgi:ATP-dependent Clp protease ATP-binding subunit ClpC